MMVGGLPVVMGFDETTTSRRIANQLYTGPLDLGRLTLSEVNFSLINHGDKQSGNR